MKPVHNEEGLIKLIDATSYYSEGELSVQAIDVSNVEGLVKAAAHSSITQFVEEELSPIEGKMYLHINAMGAGEYFGSNKNGDYFPEDNLKRYYKTFEASGHVFRHHINKDPEKSIGKVLFAVYNDRMHRVELIAEVDEAQGNDILERINMGEFPFTSMACKTPFDVCSICGNKAHTRAQYCDHLKYSLNKIYPDGRRVMALNVGPLHFFDISIVIRPADITSSILQKVASEEAAISSIDMAESEGLSYPDPEPTTLEKSAEEIKQAALSKLSTLVKKVEGNNVMDVATDVETILDKVKNPELSLIRTLSQFPLSETLNAFAELGSAPSIKFLAELIAYVHLGDSAEGLGEKAEIALYSTDPSEISAEESLNFLGDIELKQANPILVQLIAKNSDSSLTAKSVEKRAAYQPYDGYLGYKQRGEDLPKFVMSSPEELQRERDRIAAEMANKASFGSHGALKAILALGGAALLARYYISSMIDSKVKESQNNAMMQQVVNPYAKIVIEKQAGFASKVIDDTETHFFIKAKNSGFF